MQLLRQGLARQQAGDLAAAEIIYREVLRASPQHSDALQLVGVVRRRRGDPAEAEQLMRQSLQQQPNQPAVWNNLGNALEELGHREEALAAFDRALGLLPRYADALYNRARVALALGRISEAAVALDGALRAGASPSAGVLQLKASIESAAGRLSEALATLDAAIACFPDRAGLHHNRAVVLHRLHRNAESLAAHLQAAELGADSADAHYNRGNTLQALGRADEAVAAYREALRRQPDHALALFDIARLRWRMGDPDFDAELKAAAAAAPGSAVAPGILGHLYWRAERYAEAADAYRLALACRPDDARALDGLARCLVRTGHLDEGLALHEKAVARGPRDAELHANYAASLLVAGRAERAAELAEAACRLEPEHQYAQALRGLAWRALGDARAAWLNDYARFVRAVDLPPPPGWSSMAQFNEALAAELGAIHGDQREPIDQTLRRGTQTLGNLFDQGHPLVEALKQRIVEAIDSYIAALPNAPEHPFAGRRTEGWRFTDSWSSRLFCGGFHTDHVHPHGWISSAYYVSVPAACGDPSRREGWLRFGYPDLDVSRLALRPEPEVMIEPKVGRLALFPSLAWHGTRPFKDVKPRLTIAFDVQPL